MLLGRRSIAVSHRVVLCIAQFPGGLSEGAFPAEAHFAARVVVKRRRLPVVLDELSYALEIGQRNPGLILPTTGSVCPGANVWDGFSPVS